MTKLLLAIFILFFISSCCMKHSCGNPNITPIFVGFSLSDIDTFIIRKYKQNDNFLHVLDTLTITNSPRSISSYSSSNDTTLVYLDAISLGQQYIVPGNDWQIYLPKINRTISISNIVCPQTESGCYSIGVEPGGCTNVITSIVQDGQTEIPTTIAINGWGNNNFVTYIKK